MLAYSEMRTIPFVKVFCSIGSILSLGGEATMCWSTGVLSPELPLWNLLACSAMRTIPFVKAGESSW
jgi:hypothetical protein